MQRLDKRLAVFQPLILIMASTAAHLWLVVASRIFEQARPFGDLSLYEYWAYQMNQFMPIYGIETDWVYPALAVLPVWLPSIFENYELAWLVLIFAINTVTVLAFAANKDQSRSGVYAAWFFLLGLVLLGPVAISRIDSVSVAIAAFALIAIASRRENLVTLLLTVAGWIKIWPVALFVALIASFKGPLRKVGLAALLSLGILIVGFGLGGQAVLSFITAQQSRGIQIESVMGTFWIWLARADLAKIYFDESVLTNQIDGPLVFEISQFANPIMFLALAGTFFIARRSIRSGAEPISVFVWASVLAVTVLIVFNKVGSPQFMLWILIPLVAGIYFKVKRFRSALLLGVLAIGLTQLIYPVFYLELLSLELFAVIILTLRNAVLVALAILGLLRLTSKQSL